MSETKMRDYEYAIGPIRVKMTVPEDFVDADGDGPGVDISLHDATPEAVNALADAVGIERLSLHSSWATVSQGDFDVTAYVQHVRERDPDEPIIRDLRARQTQTAAVAAEKEAEA